MLYKTTNEWNMTQSSSFDRKKTQKNHTLLLSRSYDSITNHKKSILIHSLFQKKKKLCESGIVDLKTSDIY